MCYLPGSEGGNAVSDILTGKAEFFGRLPMPYYASIEQIGAESGEVWLPRGFSVELLEGIQIGKERGRRGRRNPGRDEGIKEASAFAKGKSLFDPTFILPR